ncbi:hypothetical protein E2C01_005935 [Portunus trituberculatus]|uniref:Uncharacterized protein n=1 Tax=Portunus trituberculatus TaxID=210409 RepID=A0A5B7CTZ9_PORTR|nr:hypothetical protein [Portunus trituberculatus]
MKLKLQTGRRLATDHTLPELWNISIKLRHTGICQTIPHSLARTRTLAQMNPQFTKLRSKFNCCSGRHGPAS